MNDCTQQPQQVPRFEVEAVVEASPTSKPVEVVQSPLAPGIATSEPWAAWALGLWLVLALAVGIKALLHPTSHSVWPVFAFASRHWWSGLPLYTYYPGLDMYRYSPTFAVALSPFGLLPLGIGGCLWGVGSVLLLYSALRSFHSSLLEPVAGRTGRGAFLLLCGIGTAHTAWNLQSNTLLLALMVFGTVAVAKEQWWRAAFLLAIPVYIKLWPLAGVALLAAWRPTRLLPRFAFALALIGLLPFLFGSPGDVADSYREWVRVLTLGQGLRWPGYRDMLTITQALGVAIPPWDYRIVQLAGGALALGACLLAYRRKAPIQSALCFALAIWISWQLLLGPGSERNTYGLIAPFMAWGALRGRRRWIPACCFAILVLFSAGDVEKSALRLFPAATAVLPATVAVFAAWLVVASLWRKPQNEATAMASSPSRLPRIIT